MRIIPFPLVFFSKFRIIVAWEQRKLVEVADYRNGKAHEQDIDEDGDYIVVNSKFVSTNGRVKKFSDALIEPLKTGEIAFVLSDVPNGKAIARTFLIDKNNKYSLNQRIAGITPHDDTDPYYLSVLMNRNYYFLKFDNGVGQTNLSKLEVENFPERYPNYDEQQKIGFFFQKLDETIALHQRKLDTLKRLKEAYLQNMFPINGEFVPKLRFANFEEKWEQRKFTNIVSRITTTSEKAELPRIEYEDIISGSGKLNKDIFQKESLKKGIEFEANDILYGKLRPYLKNWYLPKFKGIAVGDFWVFRVTNTNSNFIYSLIQDEKYQAAANLSTGTKMPRSDWKTVSSTKFLIPKTTTEQYGIGKFFRDLDNLIALHQQKLDQLQNLKRAYLQKMFI